MPIWRRLLLSVTALVLAFGTGIVAVDHLGVGRWVEQVGPFAGLIPTPPAAEPADAPVVDFPMAIDVSETDEDSGRGGSGRATVHGAIAEEILDLANEVRVDAGLPPLAPHADLDAVAEEWSLELAVSGRSLAHNSAYSEQIPAGWSAAGENVAWIDDGGRLSDSEVAARIHRGWMDSDGHRANILNPRYTHLGVGVAHNPSHGYYLTQNFARY